MVAAVHPGVCMLWVLRHVQEAAHPPGCSSRSPGKPACVPRHHLRSVYIMFNVCVSFFLRALFAVLVCLLMAAVVHNGVCPVCLLVDNGCEGLATLSDEVCLLAITIPHIARNIACSLSYGCC
jgi:hypothetical protein